MGRTSRTTHCELGIICRIGKYISFRDACSTMLVRIDLRGIDKSCLVSRFRAYAANHTILFTQGYMTLVHNLHSTSALAVIA